MFPATKARLKLTDDDKLHIYRKPGITAWIFLGLSSIVFHWIFHHLTENVLTLSMCALGGLMFGLDKLGDWEDFILDKSNNSATFTRCHWSEKLFFGKRAAEKSPTTKSLSTKLSEIRHVGVSAELGLFLLLKNGKTTSLSTTNLDREEIQSMRQEINKFINLARIELLDKIPNPGHNLGDRLIIPSSDSDEEIVLSANKTFQKDVPNQIDR